MGKRLRRAGSPWRILVHEWLGSKGDLPYGTAHHISNDRTFGGGDGADSEWSRHIELPGTEFDELVIGSWLHVEQQDSTLWWMEIGGVTVNVRVDRDGRPQAVDVYGPDDYAGPVEGVKYSLAWSRENEEESA